MSFAKAIFRIAGISGLLIVAPMYFLERRIGIDQPPAITHPELYYGFIGVVVAWQIAFLIIAGDPVRYRPLIPACMVEKFAYVAAILVLQQQGRVPGILLPFAAMDLAWGILFAIAFVKLKR